MIDECRRRGQNETTGHRGRRDDPLYRCRRLLTRADERLDEGGQEKLLGLLRAGDPRNEVTTEKSSVTWSPVSEYKLQGVSSFTPTS